MLSVISRFMRGLDFADNKVIGYEFVLLGKMTDFIKKGMEPNEACEKSKDTYGLLQKLLSASPLIRLQRKPLSICFENTKWAHTRGEAIAIKKGCAKAADAAMIISGITGYTCLLTCFGRRYRQNPAPR